MDKNTFSQNFNSLISQRDVKIKDLSSKTGIRPEKLSKFRNSDDPVNPSVDDLIAISNFFNITIDELLGHTKEENPQSIMLNFITLLLKLQQSEYVDIEIMEFLGSSLSEKSLDFLCSDEHKTIFPQYANSMPHTTNKIQISLDKPHPKLQCMYHDIIVGTLSESESLQKSLPYLKDVWLTDRIKKLDALYHFDEKPIEGETKDSE